MFLPPVGVRGVAFLPGVEGGLAVLADGAPGGQDRIGHDEWRMVPAELLAGACHFFGAKRRAVRCCRACLLRRTVTDHGPAGDERRTVRGLRALQRRHAGGLRALEQIGREIGPGAGHEAVHVEDILHPHGDAVKGLGWRMVDGRSVVPSLINH